MRGMTGQSSLRFSTDDFDGEMEIRSVNSRYFEFRVKTPPRYSILEIEARKLVSKKLKRGKIDLNIRINEKTTTNQGPLINTLLAKNYLEESQNLARLLNIPDTLYLRELLSLPQVLNTDIGHIDDTIIPFFMEQLTHLIDQMMPMMQTEGESTLNDLVCSLKIIETATQFIKDRYPEMLEKYKNSLKERVLEITNLKPSDERLSVELELFASRTAINEEIVRLGNHTEVMKEIFENKRKGNSKELDFIAQEMNREVNTIASKSSDFEITEQTIILKSEIEKMREQFRNIV